MRVVKRGVGVHAVARLPAIVPKSSFTDARAADDVGLRDELPDLARRDGRRLICAPQEHDVGARVADLEDLRREIGTRAVVRLGIDNR